MRKPLRRFLFPFVALLVCTLLLTFGSTAQEMGVFISKELRYPSPDSLFLSLKASYNEAVKSKDPEKQASYLRQMGQISYHLGHYSEALEYHLKASELYKTLNDRKTFAENLNDIGILYYYNRQLATARQRYDEALSIFNTLKDSDGIAVTYGKIGHLYEKQQRYDSAFLFQRKALSEYSRSGNEGGMAKIYENLGSIYEDLEQYDSSMSSYSHALDLYNKTGEQSAIIEVYNNLGDIHRKTGDLIVGMQLTRRALQMAIKQNEVYQISSSMRDLGKCYHLLGKDDSAYYYSEQYRSSILQIYNSENSRQVAFYQALFDAEKKNNEIEKLQNAQKLSTIITIATCMVIVLAIALGIVIFSRQKLKIKTERETSEQSKNMYETRHELMQAALKNKQLQEDSLKQQLEIRSRELTSHTLHVIQKNQLLEDLRQKLEELIQDEKRDQKKQLKSILQQINNNFNHDQHWKEFYNMFEQVHQSFFDKLKTYCNDLTASDLRLVALLRMNISSENIATLLGISQDSLRVSRYRLRKKLGLDQGENLTSFLQTL